MYRALSSFNTTTEVPLSKAPNTQLLPGRRSINDCPLLRVCVHGVCVFTAVCVCTWVKCRARIPSMGHHTWPYVTSLSLSLFISTIHTARWSRKIARKLPECLLCERKHVPGLIPGLILGWDLVTLPGSVPERALCEQKPDQCRKGCVVVMTHFIVRLFYRVF